MFTATITSNVRTAFNNLLDLVFPAVCLSCSREGSYLCEPCMIKLKKNEFQICPGCGKLSPFGKTHQECRTAHSLDGLISAVAYKEPLVRKLVEHCKYKFVSDISNVMALMIAIEVLNQELLQYFKEFTIVPLPLHQTRLRWRGFNQAELIARHVASLLKLNINSAVLARRVKTQVQAELNDDQRVVNVKDAFASVTISGKFILVDDVSTTRSTLNEASKALKNAGAEEVWALTFAQG